MLGRFKDRRSDYDIKCVMSNRKQNHREKEEFRNFFDEMTSLAMRLRHPLSDGEFIDIFKRNMRTVRAYKTKLLAESLTILNIWCHSVLQLKLPG